MCYKKENIKQQRGEKNVIRKEEKKTRKGVTMGEEGRTKTGKKLTSRKEK